MRRALLPAFVLAGAYLSGGASLAHAAAVTVNHGGAPLTAGALLGTSGLSLVAAWSAATGPLRHPPRRPPGEGPADPCGCDRWWTSLGAAHDTWCPNHPSRRTT